MKNYSRQREAILQVLKEMKTHPTASAVYEKVRELLPNISLGTVYRNLSALRDSGQILSLSVGDGFEHFDGDSSPHIHLHCQHCKKILDLVMDGDPAADRAAKAGFVTQTSIYIVYGSCKDCANQETKREII